MKKIILLLVILSTSVALAQADACQSQEWGKQSVAVNISSATTTQLVAASAGKKVQVCAYIIDYASGTSPTVKFEYGTGTTCGTGTTVLSGTMNVQATAGTSLAQAPGHAIFSAPAGNALCVVSGGTTPNLQGVVTYVQY